jgi:glucan phosphorylase
VKKKTVVEIAMEIAYTPALLKEIEVKMGIYGAIRTAMSSSVGGIGPLLRERIIAQSELGLSVIGITLLYEQVWVQKWHAWGQFYLEKGDSAPYIRPLLKKLDNQIIVTMPDGTEENVDIWETEFGGGKVYFLDNPKIASIVYPSAEDAPVDVEDANKWATEERFYQSWLLGRGSLVLLKLLGVKPDIIVMSETPTVFSLHDLVSDGLDKEDLFNDTKYIFNDHTPLEYAHPVWPEKLLNEFKVKPKYYKHLESYKQNPDKVDITQLIIDVSDGVYGVSKIHGEVMRNMPSLRGYAKKIDTITNGVSRDIWQSDFLTHYEKLTDTQILSAKQKEKENLIDWCWIRFKFNSEWRDTMKRRPLVMWMRRVVGYKRLDILREIVVNPDMRRRFVNLGITILLGGRIHQNDAHSDWVVFELLDMIQKHPEIEDKLVLLDNFNVWEAPKIYKGVDAAIMVSDISREASATGFMKAQMNGSMIIATEDGAIPESVYFYNKTTHNTHPNGFFVEYVDGHPTSYGLLHALEQLKAVYDDPKERIKMIRAALRQTPKVDVMRTSKELIEFYKKI